MVHLRKGGEIGRDSKTALAVIAKRGNTTVFIIITIIIGFLSPAVAVIVLLITTPIYCYRNDGKPEEAK
jgi:hypothetical protein